MKESTTRRELLGLIGGASAAGLAGCLGGGGDGSAATPTETDAMDGTETEMDGMNETETGTDTDTMADSVPVTVRIENVAATDTYGPDTSTSGAVWITPGAYAIHTGENPIFVEGEAASVGLEALAEAGPPTGFLDQPGLVDELNDAVGGMGVVATGAYTPEDTVADPNDPTGEVPGAPPIAPGGAFEFEIEAHPGDRLSFASMFVPSNDLFFSPESGGITLWPEDGEPVDGDVTEEVDLFDAGTEPNTEPPGEGPDQAPAQDSPDQGDDEGGVVRRLSDVDDGHDYPAVDDAIQVTVTPHDTMDGSS